MNNPSVQKSEIKSGEVFFGWTVGSVALFFVVGFILLNYFKEIPVVQILSVFGTGIAFCITIDLNHRYNAERERLISALSAAKERLKAHGLDHSDLG